MAYRPRPLPPLLVVLLVALVATCFTPPPLAAANKSATKQFGEVRSDESLLYLIREKRFAGSGRTMFVYADQQFLGSLDNNSYTFAYLPPGKHLLWLNWAKVNTEVELEAGRTYYFAVWSSFDPLDEISGKAYLDGIESYATPEPAELDKADEHIVKRYGKAAASAAKKPAETTRATNLDRRAKHIAEWPKVDLGAYSTLCIEPFVMADPKAGERKKEYLVESAPQRIAQLMVSELGTEAFAEVLQNDSCAAGEGTTVVRARITQYKPGSDTARLMLAGAGSAQIEMIVSLTGGAQAARLVEFEAKGLWAWGGAAGVSRGISDLEKNVAYEVAAYLQQSRGIDLPELEE